MHRLVKEHLEEYLQAASSARPPRELDSHFQDCAPCRTEVGIMAAQARLMRELKCAETVEASPGFYARVMAAVEARRRVSGLLAFTDPSFGRRFISSWVPISCTRNRPHRLLAIKAPSGSWPLRHRLSGTSEPTSSEIASLCCCRWPATGSKLGWLPVRAPLGSILAWCLSCFWSSHRVR